MHPSLVFGITRCCPNGA